MVLRSKTGLLEGVRKPVKRQVSVNSIEVPNFSRPAPYTLRPFAGVYNPFPYGCSILCNHPADYEAKDVVKRAKDSWISEGKALLLSEEMTALHGSHFPAPYDDGEDAVPEELFRRYTDTDSRPLTPAPTLASVMTRGSVRRCVTPDPIPTHSLSPNRERTLLILDLRRSHSQDTISWHGSSMPPTTAVQPPTRNITPVHSNQIVHSPQQKKKIVIKKKAATSPKTDEIEKSVNHKLQQQVIQGVKTLQVPTTDIVDFGDTTGGSGDEELPKRRGKHRRRRKKSGKDGFREPEKEFQGLAEPGETQVKVSAIRNDSQNTSTRPSLISGAPAYEAELVDNQLFTIPAEGHRLSSGHCSFIDAATLKQLQRELDQEIIDSEFDQKKQRALEEALKSRPEKKLVISEEMKQLKREMKILPNATERLLTLPRNFTRQSARFELPLDSRLLKTMTPMQYVQRYVSISSGRRQLYNKVFNRHKEEMEEEEIERRMIGKNVVAAIEEVMGRTLSEEQCKYIRDLIDWKDTDLLEFRTWSGLCALCERLLAPQFITSLPSRAIDPCHEVEQADFESLPRRLQQIDIDPRLSTILHSIREL